MAMQVSFGQHLPAVAAAKSEGTLHAHKPSMTASNCMQVTSLPIDLQSRQQQVDTMQGELQAAAKRRRTTT